MKKISNKGFTLIELLAVIVIMGILMVAAIYSVSKIIENTRKDMFINNAKAYIDAARTAWILDSFECHHGSSSDIQMKPSDLPDNQYYILITSNEEYKSRISYFSDLVQQGGKSSWENKDITGMIEVNITNSAASTGSSGSSKVEFAIRMSDGNHGITDFIKENELKRINVSNTDPQTEMNIHIEPTISVQPSRTKKKSPKSAFSLSTSGDATKVYINSSNSLTFKDYQRYLCIKS